MATYVLIHGAGTDAWYWNPLADRLRTRGHHVVAPDLPCDDESAGLPTYADAAVDAIGELAGGTPLVVVAHSFGGFTAPLLSTRIRVDLLVLLHAQIPSPRETPSEWWTASGYPVARQIQDEADAKAGLPAADDDLIAFALHDTPRHLAEEMLTHQKDQAGRPFDEPWPLSAWPDVPTRVLLARDDRFFPADFLRRHAAEASPSTQTSCAETTTRCSATRTRSQNGSRPTASASIDQPRRPGSKASCSTGGPGPGPRGRGRG